MLAIALPDSLGPYAVLLAVGFLVGWYGHGAKSNWIIAFGIMVILAAIGLLPARDRHAQRQGADGVPQMGVLDDLDLTKKLSREEEEGRLKRAWERLAQLRLTLGGPDRRAGSSARRSACSSRAGTPPARAARSSGWSRQLDPRHVRVVQFAAPTHDEKRHHFLWRFWPSLPGWGGMAVFDRSWYGRVLVERVEGFATREQWLRAYDEINGFERTLADEGTILIKFWLHISGEEQLKRFERAREGPAQDLEADRRGLAQPREARRVQRGRRGHGRAHQHRAACASGTLIPADSKRYARVAVIETVIAEIEAGMRRHGMEPPTAD